MAYLVLYRHSYIVHKNEAIVYIQHVDYLSILKCPIHLFFLYIFLYKSDLDKLFDQSFD